MKTVQTLTRLLSELADEMETIENERNLLIKEVAALKAAKERLELETKK